MIASLPRALAALIAVCAMLFAPLTAPASAQPAQDPSETPTYDPGELTDGSAPPQPAAVSWALVDLATGDLLAGSDVDVQHAPASVIKLLTALALRDVLDDPEQKVEAEYEDMEIDGTKVGIMQKNDYTVDDLFHAMLMSSANDAANALGRAAGGQEKAVELMNAKAAGLGMTGTHAVNTSGLDDPKQVTTAADIIRLSSAVLDDEYLMGIIGTETYDFPGAENIDTGEKLPGYEIQNHTRVVGRVDGGLGMKNGYTRTAKGSFAAVVERDGRVLASSVLGAETQTRESAVDLIEWGFAQSNPEPIGEIDLTRPADEAAASAEAEASASAAAAAQAEAAASASPTGSGPFTGGAAAAGSALTAGPWVMLAIGALGLGGVVWAAMRLRAKRRQAGAR